MSPSQNSNALHRNCSQAIPNCVLAEVQLPLMEIVLRENILRQLQILS